ncbi:NifU family protein [Streptomyces sp. SCA3-4]|uniref:NifU family protein n=1 Tax=Streptomyces sichuanensis TaxID=2871810 RepID=UPI001CE2FD5F|nr:NifU family protein [Streptomyces sichuanensis]MCA6096093.1 NifU family protein [Streptomyces sichuanensis]
MTWTDHDAREHVTRTEELLARTGELPDGPREQATASLHAVVELYGECLARVLRHTDATTAARLAADELLGHVLLVHDLHPDPVATRVRRALQHVRGGEAELLAVEGPVVRVRLRPTGCGGSHEALQAAVEAAVAWAAPEIERVESTRDAPAALIPVESLFRPGTTAGSR